MYFEEESLGGGKKFVMETLNWLDNKTQEKSISERQNIKNNQSDSSK